MTTEPAIERLCQDCAQTFVIPGAEQQFRRERGLALPDTCPQCRARLRMARNADLMSQFDRQGSLAPLEHPAPRRNGPRNAHYGPRTATGRQMYNTVCANCGAETQVPFVPRGDRPVYCRDCFNARRGR